MPAFQPEGFIFRDIPEYRDVKAGPAQFFLQHFFEPGVKHLRYPVQKDPPDIAVRAECRHPADQRRQGEGRPPAVYHQQHRHFKRPGHIVGAALIRINGPSVIVAHDALGHNEIRIRPVAGKFIPDPVFPAEEEVEIS